MRRLADRGRADEHAGVSLEGDPRKDAKASAGLVVTKGGKKVADMPCSGYAEFGVHFDYAALPQDTECYSAMAL